MRAFQRERRCYCALRKGSRDGCYFDIDRSFEKQLVDHHSEAAKFYVQRGLKVLLADVREALELPAGMALSKCSAGKFVRVYGWRVVGRSAKVRGVADAWSDDDDKESCGGSALSDASGRRSRRKEGSDSRWTVPCSADLSGKGSSNLAHEPPRSLD
jgi:hypothetical protein